MASIQLPIMRSFLKWPGGKLRLIERITQHLPQGAVLIEPFLGSGSIFLNTNFDRYILNDKNEDLIQLYKILKKEGKDFIKDCRSFFNGKYNNEKQYYLLRHKFNNSQDPFERASLFLYLNRHGYNGLCRYNQKQSAFNVPFGRYQKPYFPEKEMLFFCEKSKKASFFCEDFTATLKRAKKGHVIYCDPPYVPLSSTAHFTQYASQGFSLDQQKSLAHLSAKLSQKGIAVLLSNHCNAFTKEIYRDAKITEFKVRRFISCKANNREKVSELLALYQADSK